MVGDMPRRLDPFWMPKFDGGMNCESEEMRMCDMMCIMGYQTDEKGCKMCQCREDPCASVICGEGEICHVRPCLSHPCKTPEGTCIKNTICHEDSANRKDLLDVMKAKMPTQFGETPIHMPQCTPEGKYHPRQCHVRPGKKECWCVSPFGKEQFGSREFLGDNDAEPECIHERTTLVVISLTMTHELKDVDQHIPGIKKVVKEQLVVMLVIKPEHIKELEITVDPKGNLLVHIELNTADDNEADLTEPVHQFGQKLRENKCALHYKGTELKPMAHTLKLSHKEEADKDEGWKHWGWRMCKGYFRHHPKLFWVGIIGGGLFLVLTVCITCILCRKRRLAKRQFAPHRLQEEKSEKYKQNIAFHHAVTMSGEEKKEPLA